jgi:hypothetical protein
MCEIERACARVCVKVPHRIEIRLEQHVRVLLEKADGSLLELWEGIQSRQLQAAHDAALI